MAGMNKVILVGRVGADPETRRFNSGDEMAEFSLATSEQWRDKNTGEKKEKTHWHRIKVLNDGIVKNVIRPYVNKGSLIGVEGELQVEEWEKDGQKRTAVKVVVTAFRGTITLLGGRDDNGGGGNSRGRDDDRGHGRRNDDYGSSRNSSYGSGGGRPGNGSSFSRDLDDDIPFAPEWR